MEELTILETKVLLLIPRGKENKKTLRSIGLDANLNLRTTQSVINSLVFKHKIPIVGNRGQGGVFIPINNEQRLEGLNGIKNQVIDLNERIKIVEVADLDNWDNKIIYKHQERMDL